MYTASNFHKKHIWAVMWYPLRSNFMSMTMKEERGLMKLRAETTQHSITGYSWIMCFHRVSVLNKLYKCYNLTERSWWGFVTFGWSVRAVPVNLRHWYTRDIVLFWTFRTLVTWFYISSQPLLHSLLRELEYNIGLFYQICDTQKTGWSEKHAGYVQLSRASMHVSMWVKANYFLHSNSM